jgi:hypothetical protein
MATSQDPTTFMSPAERRLWAVTNRGAKKYRRMARDVDTVLDEIADLQLELTEIIEQNDSLDTFDGPDQADIWQSWVDHYDPEGTLACTGKPQKDEFDAILKKGARLLKDAGMLGKMKDLKRKVETARSAEKLLPFWQRR